LCMASRERVVEWSAFAGVECERCRAMGPGDAAVCPACGRPWHW
jgi:hypothetical protein